MRKTRMAEFHGGSVYLERKKEALIKELLKVQKCSNKELQEKKEELAKRYRKDFFRILLKKWVVCDRKTFSNLQSLWIETSAE